MEREFGCGKKCVYAFGHVRVCVCVCVCYECVEWLCACVCVCACACACVCVCACVSARLLKKYASEDGIAMLCKLDRFRLCDFFLVVCMIEYPRIALSDRGITCM